MTTNLAIDVDLLEEALQIGGFSTEKETVNQALIEFVQRRKRRAITALFGNLPQDADYNYKEGR